MRRIKTISLRKRLFYHYAAALDNSHPLITAIAPNPCYIRYAGWMDGWMDE
jgi:hypothetical protein